MKKILARALLSGIVLALCYSWLSGGFLAQDSATRLMIWTDGVSIAGILLMLVSGWIWLYRKGILDIFSYALFQARFLLLRRRDEEYIGYHDFKLLKVRGNTPLLPILLVGFLFTVAGAAMSWLYYQI